MWGLHPTYQLTLLSGSIQQSAQFKGMIKCVVFAFFSPVVRAVVSQTNTETCNSAELSFSLSMKYFKSAFSPLGFMIFIVLLLNG